MIFQNFEGVFFVNKKCLIFEQSAKMEKVLSIAIVDDHNLFRKGIKKLLEVAENDLNDLPFDVVIEAENGLDFIEKIEHRGIVSNSHKRANNPKGLDIVFLDLHMPLMDGFETLKWLTSNLPEVKVIILTMFDDKEAIKKTIHDGARSFLSKDIEAGDIVIALRKVANGEYYFPESIIQTLVQIIKYETPVRLDLSDDEIKLTDREAEFMRLACTEYTYQQIAEEMNVTLKTIDGYRERLSSKLNIKSRVGLVMHAIKRGLVEL